MSKNVTSAIEPLRHVPKLLLDILPSRYHWHAKITPQQLRIVQQTVELVENSPNCGVHAQTIILDYSQWISAIQRLQSHGFSINRPFRVLHEAVKSGEFKLACLTSREFATLANITSKSGCKDAKDILDQLFESKLFLQMTPDLKNSDFALCLGSLTRSRAIFKIDHNFILEQLKLRIGTMDILQVCVSLDAVSRLMHADKTLLNMGLERISALIKCAQTKRSASSDQEASVSHISMFTRALIRGDGITHANIDLLIPFVKLLQQKSPNISQLTLSHWTALLMHLTTLYSGVHTPENPNVTHEIQDAIFTIVYHINQLNSSRNIIWTPTLVTKICMTLVTLWNLTRSRLSMPQMHALLTSHQRIIAPHLGDSKLNMAIFHIPEMDASIWEGIQNSLAPHAKFDKALAIPYLVTVATSNC